MLEEFKNEKSLKFDSEYYLFNNEDIINFFNENNKIIQDVIFNND